MTRISPNLRIYSSKRRNRFGSSAVNSSTNLLSLPVELITMLLTYLSTPDLINFTNSSSSLRSLRTTLTSNQISSYLRGRREDQENLISTPSPDRISVGPLREVNSSSNSESPSPKYCFRTPVPTRLSAGERNAIRRRNSCSLTSPLSSTVVVEVPKCMTPLSTAEKKRRLRRL